MCVGFISNILHQNFAHFISSNKSHIFFSTPYYNYSVSRRALRFAQVAEVVLEQIATATGFSLTFKAFKYAYYGRELMNVIINDDVLSALGTLYMKLILKGMRWAERERREREGMG